MPELATRQGGSCSFTPLFRGSGAVGVARRFVRHAMSVHGLPAERIDDGCVVTSELVSNAFVHVEDANVFWLCVEKRDDGLLIEVWDPSTERPVMKNDPDGLSGRGLRIVDALSSKWGIDLLSPEQGGGKIVFALL